MGEITCKCQICQQSRRLNEIMGKLPKEDAEWLDSLYDVYLQADAELDWYKAVEDGSWPDAVSILEGWLEKAKTTPPTSEQEGV
jgi:hypothetical protein